MTPEEALTAAIQANTPLIARVGTSVYPDFVRQENRVPALPGIAYIRTNTLFHTSISGQVLASTTSFEVFVMARNRTDAVEIGDLFQDAMVVAKHSFNDRRSEFDLADEQGIWSTVFQVSIFLS